MPDSLMAAIRAAFAGCVLLLLAGEAAQGRQRLVVFAPSSLTDVAQQLSQAYQSATGDEIALSLAATSQLARQLDSGAPADVFVTADRRWMEWAAARQLLAEGPANEFAGGALVLAVRKDARMPKDTDRLLTEQRFAMAEPDSVPAGRYARQALEAKGLWERARPNAVFGENVRVTLRLVARGDIASAIVYRTDALSDPSLAIAAMFDADAHEPIRYLAATTRTARLEAADFVEWLDGAEARGILGRAGFDVPPFDAVKP